jgi:hypothetical protein
MARQGAVNSELNIWPGTVVTAFLTARRCWSRINEIRRDSRGKCELCYADSAPNTSP